MGIILYEDSERTACEAANLLSQKGFDNIFVLSGGFREFALSFSDCCEGELPLPPSPTKSQSGGRTARSGGRPRPTGSDTYRSSNTPSTHRSSAGSVRSV